MLILVFLGGVLTILSPCILPVIPLVFARPGTSLRRETAPLLAGLALAFTAAALIATATAHWLIVANEIGRITALVLMGVVGLTLVSSRAADWAARPVTRLGASFAGGGGNATPGVAPSIARNIGIGAAVGLLWAPCAGPILGLVVAAAARDSTPHAALLFFTFALGAIVSLGIVLRLGARLLERLKRAGRAEQIVRRTLGVATLATVIALVAGWDSALFAKGGVAQTTHVEDALIHRLAPSAVQPASAGMSVDEFAAAEQRPLLALDDGKLPGFDGGTTWINSAPLTPEALRGKVVLVDFWTFGCYNCLNALPHVKELYAKYKDRGFVVIGVHTPEFAHEKVVDNVKREVARLGITYPVVVDNDSRIWNAFHNQYWPAAYYADAAGRLRFHHFGEGRYEEQDKIVGQLLDEAAAYRGIR